MDEAAQELTRTILLILGGGIGVEILRTITGGITGSLKRRRAEVDRIAKEKVAADEGRRESDRRLRLVTEHAHKVRVIAIQSGLDIPDFPDLSND